MLALQSTKTEAEKKKKSLVVSTIFQPTEASMFPMTKWKFFGRGGGGTNVLPYRAIPALCLTIQTNALLEATKVFTLLV